MKLKKVIKKIVSLGAGASMVGATMLSAMAAADLSTYPAPFVKDGAFNAMIVVGEAAATNDVLGAIDIATSLQYSAKTTSMVSTGTASTISSSGDVKKIENQWVVTGNSGVVLIVCSSGQSMKQAQANVYNKIKNINIPHMYYRDDIGERWFEDSDKLHTWGYLREQ